MASILSHEINSPSWLKQILSDKCRVEARSFQLENGLHLARGTSVVVVSPPGSGKSILMAAPLLAAQERGEKGVALVVVPTKLLGEQLADVMSSYGLRAVAINEDTMRAASLATPPIDLWRELVRAEGIRVATVSPQMLSSEHMAKLLRVQATQQLFRWFFVDEAHLVHEESGEWRVAYGSVKLMRQRLPVKTVWGLFTGTATPTEVSALTKTLGFKRGHYISVRYPCDRPHIKYINRFMDYPYTGREFFDLAFVLPPEARSPADIPRTLIFCDTIDLGNRVLTFLDTLFPPSFPHRSEIVMPYNSLMSREYRGLFVKDMIDGSRLRIGVCTETCTYGLDIPCIRRVVVYGLFPSFAAGKQRLCRAGRDGLPAEAYSIVPPWVKDLPTESIKGVQAKENAARRAKLPAVLLQWHNPTAVTCPRQLDIAYNGDTLVERQPVSCCSVHDPEPQASRDASAIAHHLATHHQAHNNDLPHEVVPRSDGTHRALEATMVKALVRMLEAWRGRTWIEKVRGQQRNALSCDFLPSSIIKRIAHKAHVCVSLEHLEQVISSPPWKYLDQYGQSLVRFLGEATSGFDQIFRDRYEGAKGEYLESDLSLPVGSDAEASREDGNNFVAAPLPPIRLVLNHSNNTIPMKRSTDDCSIHTDSPKRPCIGKENHSL